MGRREGGRTACASAAGDAARPDDATRDQFEASLEHLADQAATARGIALSTISYFVGCAAEVIRARIDQRGGNRIERDAEVTGVIEVLRAELNAYLDQLAAKRPGS